MLFVIQKLIRGKYPSVVHLRRINVVCSCRFYFFCCWSQRAHNVLSMFATLCGLKICIFSPHEIALLELKHWIIARMSFSMMNEYSFHPRHHSSSLRLLSRLCFFLPHMWTQIGDHHQTEFSSLQKPFPLKIESISFYTQNPWQKIHPWIFHLMIWKHKILNIFLFSRIFFFSEQWN